MKNQLKLILTMVVFSSYQLVSAAGNSIETKIRSIQAQDNRTWINIEPGIGNATICSDKNAVEVANDGPSANPNRTFIISIALTAITTGKPVVWLTSDNCSNVNKDIIRGVKIVG